jgi:hypothetical protein
MPILPQPYPDEVIGSVIERACYQSGLPMKRLVKSLFDGSRSCVSFLMASKLAELSRNMGIDADELLSCHTMFSYAVAYMPSSEQNRLRLKALRLGEKECIGSVTRNVSHGVPRRRFCNQCVLEDLQRYGETYWRRSHLLPGVWSCSQHQIYLTESVVSLRNNVALKTVIRPQDASPDSPPLRLPLPISKALLETSLAALTSGIKPEDSWPDIYRQIAIDKGYGMPGGDIATRRLADDLSAFYGSSLLVNAGCSLPLSARHRWPELMVRAGLIPNYATAKHVLLLTFLRLAPKPDQTFGYDKPGKKSANFDALDAQGLLALDAFLQEHSDTDRRFTVQEIITEIGLWQSFRHNRNRYPRIVERLAGFRASNQSARQSGMRPYWRKRRGL